MIKMVIMIETTWRTLFPEEFREVGSLRQRYEVSASEFFVSASENFHRRRDRHCKSIVVSTTFLMAAG